MAPGHLIHSEDLGLIRRAEGVAQMEQLTLDDAERVLIGKAVDRNDGNVSRAADELGLSRSALYRRLQRYGIEAR
jgi:transcriptional regulator of acetoin/glycerol metabolism